MTDKDLPALFDDLTTKVGRWASEHPEPGSFELHSERELRGCDPDGHVTATMQNYQLTALTIDSSLVERGGVTARDIATAVLAAVNPLIRQYFDEEVAAAAQAQRPMAEVHAGLQELSADFGRAFERAMSRVESSQHAVERRSAE